MRTRLIGWMMAIGAGLVAIGCSSGNDLKICTTLACVDQFSATVQRADYSFPSGNHRIEFLADGATPICTFTFPGSLNGGGALGSCPAGLGVMVVPNQTCTTSAGGTVETCEIIPGQFFEMITLQGTPGQVHVWQYVDDVAILDVATAPAYQAKRPNGPNCDPVCQQASVAWTLQ